jgi:radical SAM superfamily enzyme YgiQ (UPF0313 family)
MTLQTKKRYRFRIIVPAYPAFNIYSHTANKTTALGPVCVATVVNKMERWDAEVIDENNLRRYGPRQKEGADHQFLQQQRPADVVGFYGGLTSTIPRLYRLAKFYKTLDLITIAGGQHFLGENIAEGLNNGLDYVVIGEGEETIQELIQAIEGKRDISSVQGIAYRQNGKVIQTSRREHVADFDKLPIPDFSLVRYANIKVYPVERIRGCGMDCEFCTVRGKPRMASSERLLEQISILLETHDARHFFIVDDLFGQQRDETIRFCQMLHDYQERVKRRLDFVAQIRLDKARDSELLYAMRQAGINMVAIGFESPIPEELTAMQKHIKPEEMVANSRIFRKFGFLVHGMFIFGYPMPEGVSFSMSARERIQRLRRFVKEAQIDTLQVLLAVPLPGTELRSRLERQQRIYPLEDVGWEYYDGNFPVFEPDLPLTPEDMLSVMKKLMGGFYQFRYLFKVGLNIFSFTGLVFFLHNIKSGWRKWYRSWRNDLVRFGGWFIVRGWLKAFKKDPFMEKLTRARKQLPVQKSSQTSS